MAKRASYQKTKERKNKTMRICFVLLMFLVSALFLWGIIESAITVHIIDHQALHTYSGHYDHEIQYRNKQRSIYIFYLDNGDTLAISSVHMKNIDLLANYEKLNFAYAPVSISLDGKNPAVSITSEDGSVPFLATEEVRNDDVGKIWLLSILFGILLLCAVAPIVLLKISHRKPKKHKNIK